MVKHGETRGALLILEIGTGKEAPCALDSLEFAIIARWIFAR